MRGHAFGLGLAVVAFALAAPGWWRPVQDPDLWWLLWAGERGFPGVNGFSWTAPHEPWLLHEPLVAWVYSAVGLHGVAPVRGLLHAVLVGLLLRLCWQPRRGWASLLALVWSIPLVSLALSERAMCWGLTLAAAQALLHLRGRHALAAGVVGVWSWVHGSFPVGVGVALLASPRHGLLTVALVLPRWEVAWLGLRYLVGQGTLPLVRAHIEEWGWLTPTSLPQALRLACLGVAAVLLRRRPALLLLLLPLALRHWRMCALAGVYLLPHMARALRLPERPCSNPLPALWLALLPVAAFAAAPVQEPDLRPGPGRLYNDLELGGWLGYRGHAVFWDPRNDCYPEDVYLDGLRVAYQHDPEPLRRRGVRQVLTADRDLAESLQGEGFRIQDSREELWLLVTEE